MPMIVSNNLNALGVRRNLNQNNMSLAKSLEKLSSGYRVNTGADAPASLVISEQLRAQTLGLERAVQNTQEANNVLGIAEGALSEMNNILKKMRQLAIHSANNGVTSPEQVAADQSEVDSSVQTIDRIARTTKYSDQFLLNGNKELTADTSTYVDDPRDMELVDMNLSDIYQIFKKDGNALNISYSDDEGRNEAKKAYFEISQDNAAASQISSDGTYSFTQDQSFTISGNGGSRFFSFASGTHLGEMVTSINSVKDSTGVKATLTYDAAVESTSSSGTINSNAINISGESHGSGTLDFYTRDAGGNIVAEGGITSVSLDGPASAGASGSSYGYSFAYTDPSKINTFTVGDSTSSSDVITMQFSGIESSELNNGEIYLLNNGGTLEAYKDSAYTTRIGSVALPGGGGKFEMTLNENGVSGKIYFGYDTVTPGATSVAPATRSTRPFAGNQRWQDGDTINFGIVTDNEDASWFGFGTSTGITAANIASNFGLAGGTSAQAVAAIEYNIQQALKEWQAAFAANGFNININYTTGAAVGNDGTDDDPFGATLGLEDTIRIGMTGFEQQSPTTEAGVAAMGGFSGDPQNKYGGLVFDMNDGWDIKTSLGGTITLSPNTTTGGASGIDFYDVLMHELGHVFGYAHPSDLYSDSGLMSYADSTSTNTPYVAGGGGGGTGAIYNDADGFIDSFMDDAVDNFYGAGATVSTVALDAATFNAGDELMVKLTSGPNNSGFSGSMSTGAANFVSAMSINGVEAAKATIGAYNPGNVSGVLAGYNTDGYGRVYMKMTSDDDYVIYKDQAMTMKVAYGTFDAANSTTAKGMNNSGLDGVISMTRAPGEMLAGYETVIQLDYMQEDVANTVTTEQHGQGVDMSDLENKMVIDGTPVFTLSGSFLSGVQLGENTSDTGDIYVKGVFDSNGTDCYLAMYKDSRMRDEDLVAQTAKALDLTGAANAVRFLAVEQDSGYDTGLYGTLNIGSVSADFSFESIIKSTNLAARISSEDYGSDAFVKVDAHEGAVWNYTDALGETTLLDAGLSGTSHTNYGQDATVSLNGRDFKLDGIKGVLSTLDTSADFVFRAGDIGLTTIAASGYETGSFATRAGQLSYNDDSRYSMLCHATGSTTQRIDAFKGGMQLQLGEGSGSQERTVISLQSMTATDLGKVYDDDTKTSYCLNDLLSGGLAGLGSDPVRALDIIDQAIKDVSEQRARIGAWQSNLLETNSSSLNVAIENIVKTESYIRDADMALESTNFSRNQIMVQAGTSMLAQANSAQQSVLSLLG